MWTWRSMAQVFPLVRLFFQTGSQWWVPNACSATGEISSSEGECHWWPSIARSRATCFSVPGVGECLDEPVSAISRAIQSRYHAHFKWLGDSEHLVIPCGEGREVLLPAMTGLRGCG